ncbi:MAG: AAA family ATPase [Prevotella sp.]|nr:AAA family ATPase [Prevotella sp.]
MRITRIFAQNYKTYKHLDLDLDVTADRSIILVGGGNGCGKTTLFDAIYHALYGLDIKNAAMFEQLFNAGVKVTSGMENQQIILRIDFTGFVLGMEQPYQLKRAYLHTQGRVLESVTLTMAGNTYTYGTGSTNATRSTNEEIVNKIIAANLPAELSKYFLFDAMKASELLKEEQINKLIEKNINSVMGFSKYLLMRKCAEEMLAEKKAERLENENQRKEYQRLMKEKQQKEENLAKLNDQYANSLEYASDHKSEYDLLLKGRNADEVTRDKMRRLEDDIQLFYKSEKNYRQEADSLTKDLETCVFFPKLAETIRTEVEMILHTKKAVSNARGSQWTEEMLEDITGKVVAILTRKYPILRLVDISVIVEELLESQEDKEVNDEYHFLTDVDTDVLDTLINSPYVNPFIALDEKKEHISLELSDLPRRLEQLEEYRRVVSGQDYSLMERYEWNNKQMEEIKTVMEDLRKEIKDLEKKIGGYDYDIPLVPDPKYDLLCKLPDFFKTLSVKLLKAKKANIERMMREQLNLNLVVYAGYIGKVELSSEGSEDISFKIYHKNGNEIFLSQLNAGAKQTVMQVLLKVLYTLGDYEPPVMIDTVMGVLDKESREVILENYFPDLAHQTILLSTDTEITAEHDFTRIKPYVAKAYTLHRDKEAQCTIVSNDYFGLITNDN